MGFWEDLGKGVEGLEDTVSYSCNLFCHVWIVEALEIVNTVMNYPCNSYYPLSRDLYLIFQYMLACPVTVKV